MTYRLAKPCRLPQKQLAATLTSASKTWLHRLWTSLFNHTSVTDYNTIIDGMILQRRFSEFLQELSMHKQCVPGSFSPAPTRAWERG